MNQSTSYPWLLSLIERLRPDICQLFPKEDAGVRTGFLSWIVTSGTREYRSILEDTELKDYVNEIDPCTGLKRLIALVYSARPDVQAAYPLENGLEPIVSWFERHGLHEHNLYQFVDTCPAVTSQTRAYEFGVNLIGYVYGQLGIGEDLRMAAKALLAADVPFSLLDFPPGKDIPQNDRSMLAYVSKQGPYSINLFCMTALEHGRFYAERGRSQIAGRYNIGYWPWELSKWPDQWKDLTRLVDEVWVSTQHTYDALVAVSNVPVFIMPMAVELGAITQFQSNRHARDFFRLPQDAKLFCFSFDLNSSFHRKNPQACVDSFLKAFPLNQFSESEVGLVIKAHRPTRHDKAWEKLKLLARQDPRIHIIEATLQRPDLLALYQCCDCFLSLHRAEGFGRGIAEALQLGLHVITTGYSGNVDFCDTPQVDLVDYSLVKIKKGQYPFGDGQVWAEADTHHAAEHMLRFVNKPYSSVQVPHGGWPRFAPATIGKRYFERLAKIVENC